jgi:hypothetical protein
MEPNFLFWLRSSGYLLLNFVLLTGFMYFELNLVTTLFFLHVLVNKIFSDRFIIQKRIGRLIFVPILSWWSSKVFIIILFMLNFFEILNELIIPRFFLFLFKERIRALLKALDITDKSTSFAFKCLSKRLPKRVPRHV